MSGDNESVHNSIYSAKLVQERLNDVCSARVAGPIE